VVRAGSTLGGSGLIGGLTTLEAGAHLGAGNSPGVLTFDDGLTFAGDNMLHFLLGDVSDRIVVMGGVLGGPWGFGGLTLNFSDAGGFGAGTYTLFDFVGAELSGFDLGDFVIGEHVAGYDYALNFEGSTLQLRSTVSSTVSSVPDGTPSLAALLGGMMLLGCLRQWQRGRAGSC
jgi:hypothetical protein